MHGTLSNIHRVMLRLQGVVGLIGVLLWAFDIPRMIAEGFSLFFPLGMMALGAAVSLVCAIPALTPTLIATPTRSWHAAILVGLDTIAPVLFMVIIMGGVITLGLPEPTSRYVAVGTASASVLAFGAMWWMALIMAFTAGGAQPPAVPRTPSPTDLPPLPPREKVDIRALRKSRMA